MNSLSFTPNIGAVKEKTNQWVPLISWVFLLCLHGEYTLKSSNTPTMKNTPSLELYRNKNRPMIIESLEIECICHFFFKKKKSNGEIK